METAEQPTQLASGLLVLCSRHGGADLAAEVHEIDLGRGYPVLKVGSLCWPVGAVLAACKQGWLSLTRCADTGRLTLAPEGAGVVWLRERRARLGVHG